MPKKARKPRLLTDRIAPSLEEKCAAYLAKGLPPDADEFDRVCFEAMAQFMEVAEPPKPKS